MTTQFKPEYMRIRTNKTKNKGSVLLVTLCTAWVIGIALVSYLTLVANQNRTTYHSQSWAACIPVLEAGIEEALTQLNYNNGEGVNNATAHGWTLANGLYSKSQAMPLADGSYFQVTINPNTAGTPATPIITAKGYVPAPGNTGTPMGGETAYGMILGTVSGQSTPAMISRTVKVGTSLQTSGGGKGGINTQGSIAISGGLIDSFDSSDPQYSTNGLYTAAKRKDNGVALSNSTNSAAIAVGTGRIYGSVVTGPGPGTVTVGSSGAVGDIAWNASPLTGLSGTNRIQTTPVNHRTSDANVQFDAVTAPFLYGSQSYTQKNKLIGSTTYSHVLDAAYSSKFNEPTITVSNGANPMLVTGGEVTLYVNGDFKQSGSGFVYIAPGASLRLYVNGVFSNSGGGVVNGSGLAKNLSVYGMSPTSVIGKSEGKWPFSGGSSFIGTVYAPNNAFIFTGGQQAFGSFSGNSMSMSGGGTAVHYDESLGGGNNPQYIASSWNEL
jgi:hypothetical protein